MISGKKVQIVKSLQASTVEYQGLGVANTPSSLNFDVVETWLGIW